jgi:hypothetical protein
MLSRMYSQIIATIILLVVMISASLIIDKVVTKKEDKLMYGYGILAFGALFAILYAGFEHFNNIRKGVSLLFSKPNPVKQANTLNTYRY